MRIIGKIKLVVTLSSLAALPFSIFSGASYAQTAKKSVLQTATCATAVGFTSDEILMMKGKAIETKPLGKEAAGQLVLWTYADCSLLMQRRTKSSVEAYRVTRVILASDSDYKLRLEKIAKGGTVYSRSCEICHVAGVAGAPKTGDKAVWSQRTDVQQMYKSSLLGKGAMPPKGGATQLSDDDVRSAVDLMLLVAN